MSVGLENPWMLLLVIPVIVAGFYLLRSSKTKIVEWRMLVAFLLILALASPYTTVTQTVTDNSPSIVVVSDETASMSIFQEGVASELYEALTAKTPTALVQLTGDKTPLGDAVLQYAGSGSQVVLVSDGNSNSGKDLTDALKSAKELGTPVYLVEPDLETNDLSVEVQGDKTLVVENTNEFQIIVRQAGEGSAKYTLKIYVDGVEQKSGYVQKNSQDTREKIITYTPDPFTTLGAHRIKAEITPSGDDLNKLNNEFSKALYVVQKPEITLLTSEKNSPLARILSSLYTVSEVSDFPEAEKLENSKALILDNVYISSLSESQIKEIKKYVSGGGGLVVVGGDQAYDYGEYLNSSLEDILPVISKPSDFEGGRNIILLLDISTSTAAHGSLDDILANAIKILKDPNLKDANAAVIAFGSAGTEVSDGFVFLGQSWNEKELEDKISQLKLTPSEEGKTSLDQGLMTAEEMLEGKDGELDAFVISDGGIEASYDQSVVVAKELQDLGVNLYFIHVKSPAPSQTNKTGGYYAKMLMQELGLENNYYLIDQGERANIVFEETTESPEETEESSDIDLDSFPLLVYSPDHFITKSLNGNISGSITGYNDVTPKAGAERLVITVTGKPVITSWRFGLGRVVAFTTDDGDGGGTLWSPVLYSGENARLISGMTNWAIGNPQLEEGAVLEAADTWLGTPAELTLTMYDEGVPKLSVDGESINLALTGRNTYEASLDLSDTKIYNISGYPLAVNYPLEYRDVGINKSIESSIAATGGEIYAGKEARNHLLGDARDNSEKEETDSVSLKVYVFLAALLLYLGEIIIRRIKEMKQLRKIQAELGTEESRPKEVEEEKNNQKNNIKKKKSPRKLISFNRVKNRTKSSSKDEKEK